MAVQTPPENRQTCPPRLSITYPRTVLLPPRLVRRNISRLLKKLRQQATHGIHLGAGNTHLEGLTNCDLYQDTADLKVDATQLEVFGDGSVDHIESHHMIEHLSFADTERALAEWHRALCDGGLLVMTYPDVAAISRRWLWHHYLHRLFPRHEELDYLAMMLVGSQEHEGMFHRNAFDHHRMATMLEKHGFTVEFSHRYPNRRTPSRLVIARKQAS